MYRPNQDDWVLDKFDVTVPMSTYLVAYSINDFEYRESNVSDVIFRIYARPEAIAQVEYAKEIGPKVLKYFEKTFKVEYPLPKMDMIAIPDFSAGAMENWGKEHILEKNYSYIYLTKPVFSLPHSLEFF